MESVLLLFVLFYAGNNPEAVRSIREFLSFYRENRDWILAFMENPTTMSEKKPSDSSESAEEACPQKESRPEEVGKNNVIEDYLNKLL